MTNNFIEYYFKKYNVIKYNKYLFIMFMIFILILLIKLYYCNCSLNEYFDNVKSNIILFQKNDKLLKDYKLYNDDLKYYMNRLNEYFVKDTNKQYANFITNLNSNAPYYQTKMKALRYPIKMRLEKDGYYIDYDMNGVNVPNKVMDITWDDYDPLPSKTIVTIYKYDQEFLNKIKDLLKQYTHLEFQMSDDKLDILYDKFMRLDNVNKYIENSNIDAVLKSKNIDIKKIKQTINTPQVQETLKKVDIKKVQGLLNKFLNSEQLTTIVKSNQAQNLIKKYGLSEISESLLANNIQISIESRDEKFLFVYNKDDSQASKQLLNLFKYIHDRENLSFLNDRITKDLRYIKIPINVMRIVIKFRDYMNLF
jgi:hypothetical protein